MERNKRKLLIDVLSGLIGAVLVFVIMSWGNTGPLVWIIPAGTFFIALVVSLVRYKRRAKETNW